MKKPFAYILIFACLANALALYENFKDDLAEDYLCDFPPEFAHQKTVIELQYLLDVRNADYGFENSNIYVSVYPVMSEN